MENKPQSTAPVTPKRSTLAFIWKHKLEYFLVLLLVIALSFVVINNFSLKRSFNKEKQQLIGQYIDETSKVFSWAIRGELLRDNREQVNQFFTNLVKEPGFRKIQLVDASNSKVIISTNKKEEGTEVSDTLIINANNQRHLLKDDVIISVTPVMGLNSRLGILVIEKDVE